MSVKEERDGGENALMKKCNLLKRKCREYEEVSTTSNWIEGWYRLLALCIGSCLR